MPVVRQVDVRPVDGGSIVPMPLALFQCDAEHRRRWGRRKEGHAGEVAAESSPRFLSSSGEEDQTRQGQRCCETIVDMIAWTNS